MTRSEIFEEYARIAREQGLISEAAEKGPRRGSDDISTIEALYGIKPNGEEKTLTEQAHPESVIIAPSHDRVNGLVENDQERQNIMVGICTKPHQAKLTGHKYAQTKNDLMNELIRLGFYLEAQQEEGLVNLADACSERMVKKAIAPALLTALYWGGGIAASVGLLGVYNNFGEVSQGIRADCQNVEAMLAEMIADDEYHAHDQVLQIMLSNVQFIREIADKIDSAKQELPSASLESAAEIKNSPQFQGLEKILNNFVKNCKMLAKEIPLYMKNLSAMDNDPNAQMENDLWFTAKKLYRKFNPAAAEKLMGAFEDLLDSLSSAPATVEEIKLHYQSSAEVQQRKMIEDRQDEEIDPSEIQSKMPSQESTMTLKDLKKETESEK